jgi:hypothetical protein
LRAYRSVPALNKSFATLLLAIAVTAATPSHCSAQASGGVCGIPAPDSVQAPQTPWSFDVWFAGGTHEPLKTRFGHVEDRALYLAGIRALKSINSWRYGDLRYTPTIVPGILATANREYQSVRYPDGSTGLIPYKKTAFGMGLIPIALEATVAASRSAGLVMGGGGGAAYFNRRIPDPEETRFNFLADLHTGLYLRSRVGTTTFGFRLQHISNGNTGRVNPGMDSRMLYVGFSR